MASIDKNFNQNKKESEEYQTVPITYNLRPKYYDDFQCKAQNCRLTCCTGWKITMNRKDYLKMRSQHGSEEFNQKMRQALHKIKNGPGENLYAEIRCNENEYCPLYTKEGLCELQMTCGYETLPEVCKIFPRYGGYSYSGYQEQSLKLACEAVLELLWDLPKGIDFVSDELSKDKKKMGTCSLSSPNLYFQDIRSLCIDLLQDRRFAIKQRILLLGMFLKKLPFDVKEILQWCTETESAIKSADIVELAKNLCKTTEDTTKKYILQNIRTLMHLLVRSQNSEFNKYYKGILDKLLLNIESVEKVHVHITANETLYEQCKERLTETFGDIEYFFENIMVSLFFEHNLPILHSPEEMWRGYVEFCNLYGIIRFVAITSCIEDVENPKDQLIKAIVLIAREVLHNDNTRKELKDLFFENESATLAHMAILLSE